MCSVFDVDDHAGMERFLKEYGVHHPKRKLYGRRRRPTQRVSIVTARHGEPSVETAIWHLYMERDGDNWQKLDKRPEYRKSRCLIPTTAWVESLHAKNPVKFSYGEPFFFCGLYKTWGDRLSCSIITIATHPRTRRYHDKSLPMVARADQDFVQDWLSGGEDIASFGPYLHPHIEYAGHPLSVRPVERATSTHYTGEPLDLS
ncbi:SOS response-associated peptidase family protein [Microbulbifer spongiae]|uniref:SOS response-associated peptidase family protein n=1 Tax=Microbulbifer spongiae TaxID=2944933 RepID=A0ABY9ECE6_9GAMM|nr:SOS response-associated peptidase family protein [Microbulbifer sp. MI-G]WKD49952.1 SOS response-associated peptidase family protein [Microbulbifer sp. MI-G]